MTEIMIIGEAWGKDELAAGKPFVGYAGKILRSMLRKAGIDPEACYMTNVFNLKPQPTNDVLNLCGPRSEGLPLRPALRPGKYVRDEYVDELIRLEKEIENVNPNLILALGATATWYLLDVTSITKVRGAVIACDRYDGRKVLPTYHPSAIGYNRKLSPILMADLIKAEREMHFPEIKRPAREIWIEPSLIDLNVFFYHVEKSSLLSLDIETYGNQITCIGFAPSAELACVIPFYDQRKPSGNYWPTLEDELRAWTYVRSFCLHSNITGHNILYDVQFLWRYYGIPVPGAAHDTMLAHHALEPELQKSLGFCASIYTDEASWKFMRKGKSLTNKLEDE